MSMGTVKKFSKGRGYGFIVPEGKAPGEDDVFVHITAVHRANLERLDEGQIVEYEIYEDRGRRAADIIRINGYAKRGKFI